MEDVGTEKTKPDLLHQSWEWRKQPEGGPRLHAGDELILYGWDDGGVYGPDERTQEIKVLQVIAAVPELLAACEAHAVFITHRKACAECYLRPGQCAEGNELRAEAWELNEVAMEKVRAQVDSVNEAPEPRVCNACKSPVTIEDGDPACPQCGWLTRPAGWRS